MKKNLWIIIIVLFSTGSAMSCGGCVVSMHPADRKRIDELNGHFKAVEVIGKGIQDELHVMNQNMTDLKPLNPTLLALTEIMTGVQDEMKLLNQKAELLLKVYKFRAPK